MPSPRGTNYERAYLPAKWANMGGVASAYYERMALDAKPKPVRLRPSRVRDFHEFYPHVQPDGRIGGMAYDQQSTQPDCLVHEDADPAAQALVESTDREPVDQSGYPSGRAGGLGPHDQPPEHRLGTDPYTPAQKPAFGAAAGGHGQLGIDPDFARRALREGKDQTAVELPSEERHSARSVGTGQQGVDVSEQELADLARKHGMSESSIAQMVLLARNDRAEARDRRRARDQGPIPFRGMPEGFTGKEGAPLAGDSFARFYTDATEVGRGPECVAPKIFFEPSRR
jgi:hypothetical protein